MATIPLMGQPVKLPDFNMGDTMVSIARLRAYEQQQQLEALKLGQAQKGFEREDLWRQAWGDVMTPSQPAAGTRGLARAPPAGVQQSRPWVVSHPCKARRLLRWRSTFHLRRLSKARTPTLRCRPRPARAVCRLSSGRRLSTSNRGPGLKTWQIGASQPPRQPGCRRLGEGCRPWSTAGRSGLGVGAARSARHPWPHAELQP